MPTVRVLLSLIVLVGACKPPPDERNQLPGASPTRGLAVIERVGCGSCHAIPGLQWPEGSVGPTLRGFSERNLISGHLPNRPDILAAYVRNAPEVLPGTTMPGMPITRGEARDVAAYLYTLREG